MLGLGFPEQSKMLSRTTTGCRNRIHDSAIFTNDSNFRLLSSASANFDRRLFTSDQVYDHETLISQLSEHLAGSDPDLGLNISKVQNISSPINKGEEYRKDIQEKGEEDYVTLDPSRCSFSQALRDCQHPRVRLQSLVAHKKPARKRPVSLDLNNRASNYTGSPPQMGDMRKTSKSSQKLDTFRSPGTPTYWHDTIGSQKGWSSERVPFPAYNGRSYVTAGVLPFNHGRTLPSKWEDAEKWIFSPFAGDGINRSSRPPPPHRRPKSKSGPIGELEIAYASAYSPSAPIFRGRGAANYMARSPFSTGVLIADDLPNQGPSRDGSNSSSGNGSIGNEIAYAADEECCLVRSGSTHGWSSSVPSQTSLSGSRNISKEAVTTNSHGISRRDIATQMSPGDSTHASPKRTSFSPPQTSLAPITEMQSHNSKMEVRDVEVDERVTMTRWPRKHRPRVSLKELAEIKDQNKRASETEASVWEVDKTDVSKSKREEAKIAAWENLQKAKAETSLRKLEMKLEKKRSSSLEKIMEKLRRAQRKAQSMRNTALSMETPKVARTSSKAILFRKNGRQISSLSGCFTCHAF